MKPKQNNDLLTKIQTKIDHLNICLEVLLYSDDRETAITTIEILIAEEQKIINSLSKQQQKQQEIQQNKHKIQRELHPEKQQIYDYAYSVISTLHKEHNENEKEIIKQKADKKLFQMYRSYYTENQIRMENILALALKDFTHNNQPKTKPLF